MKKLQFAIIVMFILAAGILYSQWTYVGSVPGFNSNNASVSVAGENIVWLAGGTTSNGPLIYRSTNGGMNFINVTGTGITLDLFTVWAIDANTAYVGDGGNPGGTTGGNAKVYKTTNGGTTWTEVISTGGTKGFINGIVFSRTNPQFGIIESDPPNGPGQPFWIAYTTNGGINWTVQNPPGISGAASAWNSVIAVDQQFYGFGLSTGTPRIYLTTNSGANWSLQNISGLTGSYVSGFAFSDDKTKAIAGTGTNPALPNIGYTTNGGTSWGSAMTVPGLTGYCTCKWITGTNICYVAGQSGASGVIARSSNGGASWSIMNTAGVTGIFHLEYYKSGGNVYLYAYSTNGSVIKYNDNLTGLDPNNTTIPDAFSLKQNYPNPFNPATTINYSVPVESFITIKIYNSMGSEIMALVEGKKTAGNYGANADLSKYPSGVYYYIMKAGNFKESRKMILVK